MSAWKRPIFGVTLIQAVVSKTLRLFYKIIFFLQNIRTLKKSFVKYPRPFRVNKIIINNKTNEPLRKANTIIQLYIGKIISCMKSGALNTPLPPSMLYQRLFHAPNRNKQYKKKIKYA